MNFSYHKKQQKPFLVMFQYRAVMLLLTGRSYVLNGLLRHGNKTRANIERNKELDT